MLHIAGDVSVGKMDVLDVAVVAVVGKGAVGQIAAAARTHVWADSEAVERRVGVGEAVGKMVRS